MLQQLEVDVPLQVVPNTLLDLAVTWTNYAAATTDLQRTADIVAANYASAVLESSLEAIYSILILSLGILVIGLVMRRADLGKGTAYVGIATGVMGIVAALGPFFASA